MTDSIDDLGEARVIGPQKFSRNGEGLFPFAANSYAKEEFPC